MNHSFLIAFSLTLAACNFAGTRGARLSAPARAPDDSPSRWLGPDIARARAAGAGAATLLASGAGAAGDNLGGRITVPADSCALFLGRASPTVEDVDLFVYADDGNLLGSDETSRPAASVLVCPPHPSHVYAFARIAAGRGLFALSAELVSTRDALRAAEAVGAAGKAREEAVAASAWPGLDDALAARRRDLGGIWRDARRVAVPMDPSVPTRVSVGVESNECVDVLVLPAEDVAFVELTALDSEGRLVGRAASESGNPSLILCAGDRTEVTFELRPRAGRGLAAVVTSISEDPSIRRRADAIVAPSSGAQEPLDTTRTRLGERLKRDGYSLPSFSTHGTTGVGRRVSIDLDVPKGCSRLDVMTGAPARGVDAWLWSSTGALVAHDDGESGATLFACGANPHARVDVEASVRAGPFALELRPFAVRAKTLSDYPLAAGRLLGKLSSAQRIRTPLDLDAAGVVSLKPALLSTNAFSLAPGNCLDVALALGAGAEGAELRLVNGGTNEEIALVRGTYSALAEACSPATGAPTAVRVEMRVEAGSTDALLGTHVRQEARAVPRH